jgi:hypothetical protein
MKSLYAIGIITFMFSGALSAHEMESKDCIVLSSEMLSLPELLSHIEDTVWQLVDTDEETSLLAYYELQESLKVVYAFNCLYPEEAATILQTLDECYVTLIDALDRNPDNDILIQSLLLFPSGRNYDHATLVAQPLQDWTNTITSSELKSAIETADADLIYIQDSVLQGDQKTLPTSAAYNPSRLFYNKYPSQNSVPRMLIIKHKGDSSEYEGKVGANVKLGGKDHGKASLFFEGKVKDKNGGYLKGKISKEQDDDGCNVGVEVGKKKGKG